MKQNIILNNKKKFQLIQKYFFINNYKNFIKKIILSFNMCINKKITYFLGLNKKSKILFISIKYFNLYYQLLQKKFFKIHSKDYDFIKDSYYSSKFVLNYLRKNIKKKFKLKSFQGIKHQLNLPVRGQRTHTNRKTQKFIKRFLKIKI